MTQSHTITIWIAGDYQIEIADHDKGAMTICPEVGGVMGDVAPFAVLSSDGHSFRLSAGAWSGTYRIGDLNDQLAFYRRMRDRNGGAQARFYEATVRALEQMQVRA